MRWTLAVVAFLLSLISGGAAPAPTYYVSPAGNDAWSGKLLAPNAAKTDGPFATLAGAQAAIARSRPEGEMTRWTTVYVRAGKYCLSETLKLEPQDSRLTFAAYQQEKPQIIGGRVITGLQPGPGGVWSVSLPEVKAGTWNFRSLFVNGQRMIRARNPNFDPSDPYRKGFAYVGRDVNAFGIAVGNIHNVGDWMDYKINVPEAGDYTFWVFYGAQNQPFGNDNMDGRTAVSVDGGDKIPLVDLPDTGSWAIARWGKSATLTLTAGEHTLRWENLKGGGLNLEAFALCNDPTWKPTDDKLPPVAAGKHMQVIQAESFVASHGPQLSVGGTGKGAKDKFPYTPGDLQPEWAQAPEAEVHIFQTGNCRAFKEICWIDKIVPEERTIYLKGPECSSALHTGDRYFVENVRDALDAPGEWYLDRAAGMLYLIPPKGFSAKSEVMAPNMERIIEAPAGVDGLALKRLTFRGGDWDFADGVRGYGMGLNGVVYLKGATKCEVRDCAFVNIGKDAVCLEGGEGNSIIGNDITDSAEGGININGSNANEISGNHIHHCGQVYKHNGAITLQNGAGRNVVRENVVHDMTRYGITMKSAGHENVVERNRVLNTNLETYDTGGIEVTQQDRNERSGTQIIGNIVGDTIGYSSTGDKPTFLSWSIYLDSFAGGYTVRDNICYRSMHGGIMFQGGKDNVVTNNLLLGGDKGQGHISNFARNMTGCVLERNIVAWANPTAYVWTGPALTAEIIRVDRNLYFCPNVTEYRMGYAYKTFADWQKAGHDLNSLTGDPRFVDPTHDDYTLKADSPAFKLGFEKIDTSRVPQCKCKIIRLGGIYFDNEPWPGSYR
jgi:parallel beta-helix repeat protein